MTNLHHPHRAYSSVDRQHSDFDEEQHKLNDAENACLAPLHRYVHMNDSDNTQIFTFLLLPHLLCGLVDYVQTRIFQYAEHEWIVRFERTDTHLGFFLELLTRRYESYENASKTSTQTANSAPCKSKHKINKRITQWKTVTVDFEFIIRNRDIFSQNECFSKLNCTFTQSDFRHGRKNVIDLASLSSKRFLFDDGKCIIELGLRNPRVCIKLQANQVKDPAILSPLNKKVNKSRNINPIILRRMDNTTITFPGTIHFETDQFFYADDSWVLTIDIEPYRDSLPNANLNNGDNQNLCADVELCLTKQIPHKNNCTYQEIEKPLGTNWIHLTCKAYLPGDCNTGLMEFLIGSHGWPMKAHCCKFDEKTKHDLKHEQTDQGRVDNTKCDSSKYSVKAKLHSSVSAFLLSSVSSNFTFTLEMKLYERLTVVNFPLNSCENTNFSDSCSITDPFQLQWRLFMCTSSRLIRLGLIREQKKHVIDHESQYMTSNKWSPRRHAKHQHSEHFSIPSVYMDLVGCKLRIHGYQSDASHPNTIEPVGKEILQLMFTKSDVYEEPMPYERRQHNHTKVAQNNLNVFLIDYLSHNVLKSDALELWRDLCNNGIFDVSIKDSERLYRKANQISIGQIAMEITRQELTDTNMGLFNPKTGTIIIEIHWIYRHQVYIDTLYQTDEIGARQYQQMRSELMRITKERDELERQLMAFQLGFVQIDSHSLGPKSMLPLESVTGNVGQPRRPPSKSNEDWYDSKRHVEKVEAQLFSHRMDNVSSVGYISRSTKPHVISSSSPSYYTSSRSNTSKPSDLSLTSLLEVSNRRSSFDYEFSDEQLPGTSNSIHRPCSSQLLSSSTGLSEKRKQFLGSKSNWKTCEAPKYRSDFDYSQVCGYRYSMQKSRSDRESGQNYMVGNSSPCSISDSSTSRAFTSRSEHEFSFASK